MCAVGELARVERDNETNPLDEEVDSNAWWEPPSLKHAHNYVILLCGTGLFSVCMAVNMFTHSLWIMHHQPPAGSCTMWFVNS